MAISDSPATGAISATEALEIRRQIYGHQPLTPADMDLVFRTAQKSAGHDSREWTNLFAEAVTDYVVHQNDPADYIPQEKADWLVAKLKEKGGIASASEFAMLVDMMKSALGVPPSLSAFVLHEIETAMVSGHRNAIGGNDQAAATVTKADVEALRSVLYAATTGSVAHVTREEAEALFDIAHATADGTCDPAFDDLFARAVGNYLMAICWHDPSRNQALHRERWLDERETLFQFLSHRPAPGEEESFRALLKSPLEQEEADTDRAGPSRTTPRAPERADHRRGSRLGDRPPHPPGPAHLGGNAPPEVARRRGTLSAAETARTRQPGKRRPRSRGLNAASTSWGPQVAPAPLPAAFSRPSPARPRPDWPRAACASATGR